MSPVAVVWNGFCHHSQYHTRYIQLMLLLFSLVMHFGITHVLCRRQHRILFFFSIYLVDYFPIPADGMHWTGALKERPNECGGAAWMKTALTKWFKCDQVATYNHEIDRFSKLSGGMRAKKNSSSNIDGKQSDRAVIFVHEPPFNTFYKSIRMP